MLVTYKNKYDLNLCFQKSSYKLKNVHFITSSTTKFILYAIHNYSQLP